MNRTERDLWRLAVDFNEGKIDPITLPARLEYIAAGCRHALEIEKAANGRPNAREATGKAMDEAVDRLRAAGVSK